MFPVRGVRLFVLAALCPAALLGGTAQPADPRPAVPSPAAAAGPVVVLDTIGLWRMHNQLRPPVIAGEDGAKPILYKEPWLDRDTEAAANDWMAHEFDDGGWIRAVLIRACRTPYLARLCLRGRFAVTDPAAVKGLTVTVGYHGGAIVYVNGREVKRANLPEGPVTEKTLAEAYPAEAYLASNGALIGFRDVSGPEIAKRIASRERTLEAAVPAALLRKGVNVLAVEIVRAPYHKLQEEKKVPDRNGKPTLAIMWNTCEIKRLQVTAAGPGGLVPNATRPAGMQAWNSDLYNSEYDMDWGDPTEAIRPVKITAAKNGAFSGKLVVGSDKPLKNLQATASALQGNGSAIPASAVKFRYALPWGSEYLKIPYTSQTFPYPWPASLLSCLVEKPPAEIPVYKKTALDAERYCVRTPNQPEPVAGAVVPVWITVSVPAGAKPGKYTGQVRVQAEGERPVTADVELVVTGWSLPPLQDYRTWLELIQSPDTLAMEYGLPLYCERHWKMIEESLRLIGRTNSRVLHVPLLAQTNLGHEQSMVRWIRKGEARYEHDFSVLDRYLDAAEKNMGKPKLVCFWVWDIYLTEKEMYSGKDHLILEQAIAARDRLRGTGPLVTTLDPATGQLGTAALPPYKSPASKALWQPVMQKIGDKMQARGLEQTMMLGIMNDVIPPKEDLQFFADLWPGVPWVQHAHSGLRFGEAVHGVTPLAYRAVVWGVTFSPNKSLSGWKGPNLLAYYDRDRELNAHTPIVWGHLAEVSITGDQRGVGRVGADYWRAVKDKSGRRKAFVWERYPQSSWRNLDLWSYVLGPGPDGPAAIAPYEYLREGIQLCEARIVIEQALADTALREKLGDELALRCQAALDLRQWAMVKALAHQQMYDTLNSVILGWHGPPELVGHTWFPGSGWQQRNEDLFSLAAEVTRKTSQATE